MLTEYARDCRNECIHQGGVFAPVLFIQKKTGIHKTRFILLKFRSKKMSAPHDMPPRIQENSGQYILKRGRWMRKMSIDGLSELIIIFFGNLKIILMTVGRVLKRRDTVRSGTSSDVDFGDWLVFEGKVGETEYKEKQEKAKQLLSK